MVYNIILNIEYRILSLKKVKTNKKKQKQVKINTKSNKRITKPSFITEAFIPMQQHNSSHEKKKIKWEMLYKFKSKY